MAAVPGVPDGLLPYLRGNINLANLPKLPSREIRIYLSCTQTDMDVERTALIERVYPGLRDYCCAKYGLEFHVVDLRWGLEKELHDDDPYRRLHEVELEECRHLSAGPNFIALVGQKYGERPLPATIPTQQFQALREALQSHRSRDTRDAALLDFWYREDANAAPPAHVLQAQDTLEEQHKVLHLRSVDGKKQTLTWDETKRCLRRLLVRATKLCVADGTLTEECAITCKMSDLEREIQKGVLNNVDPQNCCLVVHRDIIDLKNYAGHPRTARFMDTLPGQVEGEQLPDDECGTAIEQLTNNVLHRFLSSSPSNTASFKVLWKFDNGIDRLQHAEYIEQFCNAVGSKMRELVDRVAHGARPEENVPPLVLEVVHHWQQVQRGVDSFVGRQEALQAVHQYVTSQGAQPPLVVTGSAGAGKSALLSQLAAQAVDWLGPDCVTAVRYLGTSHASFDIRQVLHSLCMQLGHLLHEDQPFFKLPNTMADLLAHWHQLLDSWPSHTPLLVVLDSLHMLVPQYEAHQLRWLPTVLQPHVKVVVSTLPSRHELLDRLRRERQHPETHLIDLPPMPPSEGLELLDELLARRGRQLSPGQRHSVNQALTLCGWPLYVRLLAEEAVKWHSWHQVSLESLPRTVATSVEQLLSRLESELGPQLVGRALSYMTASMTGLSDAEMEDVLSLDEAVLDEGGTLPPVRRLPPYRWLRLKDRLRPFLVRQEWEGFSVYFWSHRQFVEIVHDRYLLDDRTKKTVHSLLADYFLGVWAGKSKPYESQCASEQLGKRRLGVQCSAERYVPAQHLTFTADDGTVIFNRRKYDQVPRHLFLSGRLQELNDCVLFNYEWLYNKTKALSLEHVLADFVLNPGVEATLVERALRDAQVYIEEDINTLGVELTGRLLAYYRSHTNIRHLIQQADRTSLAHCALVPNFPYYQVPGSPLKHVLHCREPPTSLVLGGADQRLILAKMAADPDVQIFDLATGEHVRDIETSVGDMFITPNGKRLVIVDHTSDRSIKIHSSETGEFLGQLIPLNNVKLSPKEKYRMGALSVTDTHLAFIVTADVSYLCVADVEACALLEIQGLDGRASVCHLTPDGQYVFTNSNTSICSYDLYTSERVSNVELEYKPSKVLITQAGNRGFLINDEENKVYVMYLKEGHIDFIYKVVVAEYFSDDAVQDMSLSHSEELLLIKGRSNLVVYSSTTERVVTHLARPADIPREFKLPKRHYVDIHFTQADFSPDSKFVMATIFRHVYVWSVTSGRLLTSLQGPVGILDKLRIPCDRGQLVTQLRDSREMHVWGLGDAIGHVGVLDKLTNSVADIQLARDDLTAFIRCRGSDEIGVLNMRTGQLVDLLTHPSPVTSFSLTPNGKYALVATESSKANTANKIWYLEERKVIYEFGNVSAYSATLHQENCLIAIVQEDCSFKAPFQIKLYTFDADQFEECRLSYEVKFMLVDPFVTPGDKYLVMLTADGYDETLAVHHNTAICAISLKANMAVSTFSVDDLRATVGMQRILSVRPYGNNAYSVIAFFTNEPDVHGSDGGGGGGGRQSRRAAYSHCYGFMIFDVCSGVVCQVIEDLVAPQTPIEQLLFTKDVSLCIDPQSHVYDMANGYFLKRLPVVTDMRPRCLALDGRVVLYADSRHLVALRVSDGKQVARVHVPGEVTCVSLCHDERTVVIGCADGSLVSYVLVGATETDQHQLGAVLSTVASRQNAISQTTGTGASRSWDKVDVDGGPPPYSRPASSVSMAPSDQRLLQSVKPLSRPKQAPDNLFYMNSRSKSCAVM